jgi:hypothetical protein
MLAVDANVPPGAVRDGASGPSPPATGAALCCSHRGSPAPGTSPGTVGSGPARPASRRRPPPPRARFASTHLLWCDAPGGPVPRPPQRASLHEGSHSSPVAGEVHSRSWGWEAQSAVRDSRHSWSKQGKARLVIGPEDRLIRLLGRNHLRHRADAGLLQGSSRSHSLSLSVHRPVHACPRVQCPPIDRPERGPYAGSSAGCARALYHQATMPPNTMCAKMLTQLRALANHGQGPAVIR